MAAHAVDGAVIGNGGATRAFSSDTVPQRRQPSAPSLRAAIKSTHRRHLPGLARVHAVRFPLCTPSPCRHGCPCSRRCDGPLIRASPSPQISSSPIEDAAPDDGNLIPDSPVVATAAETDENETEALVLPLFGNWKPPRYLWRAVATVVIGGQVIVRILQRRVHVRNSLQQLEDVGPRSLGVCVLTASFVGMAFTIQFVREFARLGLTRAVGGVLSLALSRELSPVVTAIIVAGRVGSAFAAELGTMQVSEQTDTLRVLRTDPIDYLVTPRVIACSLALPILTLISFTVGMAASVLLADSVYNVSANIILDSAKKVLQPWDFISTMIKSTVFGGIISIVSCAWGVTTLGGAKGVGESTTSAVVISLVWIFIADFMLSWCFFHGAGDALKRMN